MVERFARYFIAPEMEADPETLRRAQVVLLFSALIVICAPAFVVIAFFIYQRPVVGMISVGAALMAAVTPPLLRLTRSVPAAAGVLTLAITINVALAVASAEGLTSPALPWLALIPVFAIATAGRRAGVVWSLICLLLVVGLLGLTLLGWLPNEEMLLPQRQSAAAWNTMLLVVFIAGFMLMHEGLASATRSTTRSPT